MRSWWPVVASLCIVVGSVLADEIKKKDGTVIKGEVIEEDGESVTIRNKLGDIKVQRSEIATVKRDKGLENDFDKLKKETKDRLELLAKQALKLNRKEAADALRIYEDAVERWVLTPMTKKPNTDPVDWIEVKNSIDKIWEDRSLTEADRKLAMVSLATEVNGRPTRVTLRVEKVTHEFKPAVSVWGFVGGENPRFDFTDAKELEKIEKLKKDDVITIEGAMRMSTEANYLPDIRDPKIVR